MEALLKIAQLFPIILACAAAIVAFVLGAKPIKQDKRLRDVLRDEPFLLSPVIVASLITSFVAAVAIIVRPLSGDVSFATPSNIILSTPTTTSVSSRTSVVPIAGVLIPYTVTPSPSPTYTPTPTPTPTQTSTTEPPTSTPTGIPVLNDAVALTETMSPSPVPSAEPTRAVNPGPTPTPLPAHRALIPTHCIDNEIALRQGFGFKEPRSHGTFTSFQIVLGDAANYTIRYAREDLVPVSTNITDWPVPWTCEETSNGPRCQRDRPGRNDINSQGTIVVPNISWAKEDATYTFLLQIELRQDGQMREWCAYVYGVR